MKTFDVIMYMNFYIYINLCIKFIVNGCRLYPSRG